GQPRRGPAVVSRRRRRSSRLHAVSERDTHPPERRGHGGGAYQSGNGSGLGAGPLRIVDVLPVAGEGTAGHGERRDEGQERLGIADEPDGGAHSRAGREDSAADRSGASVLDGMGLPHGELVASAQARSTAAKTSVPYLMRDERRG